MNKHPLKSVTILSQIAIIIIVIAFLCSGHKPLEYVFTKEHLCDWAFQMGRGQKLNLLCTAIISFNLIGVWGRMRIKK